MTQAVNLAIGPPGDRYEQEADCIAEQVIHIKDVQTAQPASTLNARAFAVG